MIMSCLKSPTSQFSALLIKSLMLCLFLCHIIREMLLFQLTTSLGRLGFHSPCHPNELWVVLIANSSRQSLLILLGTYEHSLHTLIHRIFPPSLALQSLNFDFKLFSSSSYKAGVSLLYSQHWLCLLCCVI